MGVTGLWPILEPSARPTPLPTLNRKRLAVDASIWIYQFLKAVRDKEGNALPNSHIVGFFRRICKLLYFGIKPVFVFDGGAPVLKRQTIQSRRQRREGKREDAVRTAGKLLALQIKRRAEEEEELRKRKIERNKRGLTLEEDEEQETFATDKELVYVDEMGMSLQERNEKRKFHKTDAYHLPELPNNIEGMGQPNDPRVMSAKELEEYAKQFNNGEDINLYDFSKIDFDGEFFMSLPASDRYNILNAARLRSRLRMGLSKDQLEIMFPDRMEFSRFQIDRVRERNELTQRLMNLNGMNDDLIGVGTGRIAADSSREYVLVRNEGVEGGWALGVVSADKNKDGKRSKPIDVDTLGQRKDESFDSDEEDDFEDIPVEGLNRLPKLKQCLDTNDTLDSIASEDKTEKLKISLLSETADSLFIEDNTTKHVVHYKETNESDLNQAIAMSLDQFDDFSDADEHVKRAIELSLQSDNQRLFDDKKENSDLISTLELNQKAVQAVKSINTTEGNVIARICNNRANAATFKLKAKDISSESDEEVDLLTTLTKARRLESSKKVTMPTTLSPENPPNGPLPFEKLNSDLSYSEGSSFKHKEDEKEKEELEGGFNREMENDKTPRPIPPWLEAQGDIRSDIKIQRKLDAELNEEDELRAKEDQQRFLKDKMPIFIESSDDEDDVKILDEPPLSEAMTAMDLIPSIISQKPQNFTEATPNTVSNDIKNTTISSNIDYWSESDYGDAKTALTDNLIENKKSASPEFEEVQIQTDVITEIGLASLSRTSSQIFSEETEIFPLKPLLGPANPKSPNDEYDTEIEVNSDEKEYYSDPDDEELLAQLAIEAQEHGRFASTLNNKSQLENQQEYEKELKALRFQQKKDRRDADEVSQTMTTECQALLRFFGIPYITAPMEAEAQCAELVRLSLVDGVVTDDCDIFLFGGTRVYKNMFNSNKYVECYLATDIEKELSLSRENLISMAHLLGSDYTEGLPGIGPVTALEIISEFSSISDFAAWWRTAQYSTDIEQSNFRKKFRRNQAAKLFLPTGFPSPAVSEAYWNPEVDKSREEFQWGVPDLEQLRNFLMATIGWSRERTDEVLVPVIRDMNRREAEGTQSNITQFFEGGLGVGVRGEAGGAKNIARGSKRMCAAVGKLKVKKLNNDEVLNKTFADEAREWVQREKSRKDKENEDQLISKASGKRKRARK